MKNEIEKSKNEFMRYQELSTLLSLPIGTLYGMVSRKKIPFYRVSRRMVLFKKEEIFQWLKKNESKGDRNV